MRNNSINESIKFSKKDKQMYSNLSKVMNNKNIITEFYSNLCNSLTIGNLNKTNNISFNFIPIISNIENDLNFEENIQYSQMISDIIDSNINGNINNKNNNNLEEIYNLYLSNLNDKLNNSHIYKKKQIKSDRFNSKISNELNSFNIDNFNDIPSKSENPNYEYNITSMSTTINGRNDNDKIINNNPSKGVKTIKIGNKNNFTLKGSRSN